jgi:hypothetical protein
LKNYILVASLFIVLFSACSTKEVFEPKELADDWDKYASVKESIVDTSLNVAELEDKKVLTHDGILDIEVQEDQRVLSLSDAWVISSSIDGNLTLTAVADKTLQEHFELKKTIASASVKGDILAVLFADNEMSIYSIATKEILFKEQGGKSLAVNAKIVNPYFLNGLVLFATLDGKVVIVNIEMKKRLRTVIVSSEDNFNNIIYMNVVDNKIIAATGYKILSLAQKETRVKYEIRDIIYDGKDLYIATKQGEVISLTPELQVNSKIKFPFAHFLGMVSDGDYLYILEKEGYIIKLNKNMKDYTVHEVNLSDGYIFVTDKEFYVDDEKILIK